MKELRLKITCYLLGVDIHIYKKVKEEEEARKELNEARKELRENLCCWDSASRYEIFTHSAVGYELDGLLVLERPGNKSRICLK